MSGALVAMIILTAFASGVNAVLALRARENMEWHYLQFVLFLGVAITLGVIQ